MVAYWSCAAVTAVSAAMSLGYSIAAARAVGRGGPPEARYAVARSVALMVISVVPLLVERHDWLVSAAVAMILVQASDALVGVGIRDRLKTFGPAVAALTNLAVLLWYVG
jgi:hypothetical protein